MRMRMFAVAGLLVGLSAAAADGPDEVVAKMGAIEIKRDELDRMLNAGQENNSEASLSRQAVAQALRTELIRRALLSEARRNAWDKRPDVQRQIEVAREQVIVTSFIDQQVRPAVDYPSAEEVQSAYDANKPLFMQPTQLHLMQIYLPAAGSNADSSKKARQKADELWKQANKKGADFSELARKYSKHAESAGRGGDMGWLQEDLLVPEIRAVAQKLSIGEISSPVKAADGWHIVKMVERKAPSQKQLAEVRDRLIRSMRLKKAQENEQQYLNQLLTNTPITVNESSLSSFKDASK